MYCVTIVYDFLYEIVLKNAEKTNTNLVVLHFIFSSYY